MRTINAPGVEIKEIDKSGYSPAMVGTGCYVMLFADKGEPYRPMNFTSRYAFEKYYGTPDNEAERYGYAAACEVLNQNGRLWCARLPYDNAAFEKIVGVKYSIRQETVSTDLSVGGKWEKINIADPEIQNVAKIFGGRTPVLYDLSAIDELRQDEAKVPADTFLIVDITNGTYNRVKEDDRKGQDREVIGIVPVVTTAANALYAQSLIKLDLGDISSYESLKGDFLKTLEVTDEDGKICSIDGYDLSNAGLSSIDLVKRINTDSYFQMNLTRVENQLSIVDIYGLERGEDGSIVSAGIVYTNADSPDNGKTAAMEMFDSLTKPGSSLYNEKYEGFSVVPVTSAYYLSAKTCFTDGWYIEFKVKDGKTLPDTQDAQLLLSSLNSNAQKYTYTCEEDARGVGIELAKDALQKRCIDQIFEGTVEPIVCANYRVDKDTGTLIFVDDVRMFISDVERDLVYAEYAADPEHHRDLAAWTGTGINGSVTSEDDPEKGYAIISAVTISTEVPLDETDPLYGVHGLNYDDNVPETMALDAAKYFSTIHPADNGGFEPDHLKDIGVVVYRCYLDPAEGNKVSWEPVEAYCGSLCKDDKDPNTGVTKFIDTIINTNSQYINFFSNCFSSTSSKKFYLNECDILVAEPCEGAVLGFYKSMTKEDISISKSIYGGMNKCFEKVEDINKLQIDIVCDAGISNIASYLKAIFGDKGPYDLMITDDLGNPMLGMWKCKKYDDPSVKTWKTVVQKLDNFCKNVRKDCMFITECPRPLVLQGQKKVVRDTKPNTTIDADILPYIQAVCGLNTNYGAGYMDWFEMADDYTGDFFWVPPSIKAMGVYVNTDVNYEYWDAPAGLNRGVIQATDVSFSPTMKQAGAIYEKNWNYAINYPQDGIVLEGQKTFQTKPSAFDRVNVRRLFLRLERAAYQVSRYFVYEGNTAYTRQRLVDALDPYFKDAKNRGGIYDYKIICDESINDPDTIDRNELKVKIGIKPVKTAEFILIDFICLRTGGSWAEM